MINEDSLQSHVMEISRRPVAAKRLGLVEQYVDSLLDEETIIGKTQHISPFFFQSCAHTLARVSISGLLSRIPYRPARLESSQV